MKGFEPSQQCSVTSGGRRFPHAVVTGLTCLLAAGLACDGRPLSGSAGNGGARAAGGASPGVSRGTGGRAGAAGDSQAGSGGNGGSTTATGGAAGGSGGAAGSGAKDGSGGARPATPYSGPASPSFPGIAPRKDIPLWTTCGILPFRFCR